MSNFPDPKENDDSTNPPTPSYTPPTDYYPPTRDTTDDNEVWKGSVNGRFNLRSEEE